MAYVEIPPSLRKFTNDQELLNIDGLNLSHVFNNIIKLFPLLKPYLIDNDNKICSFINVYINGKDVRFLANLETPVKETDKLSIIPALAGG